MNTSNPKILTQASQQWASRPDDQRFTSLHALDSFVQEAHNHSKSFVLPSKALTVQPARLGFNPPGQDKHKALEVVGPNGGGRFPTHWAFGQLCSLVGAKAGYLRTLPAPIVSDCLNYGLQFARESQDISVLLSKGEAGNQLRAVNGPKYGRVWNAQITNALVDRFGDGLTGDFRVPGEFGVAVDVTKENTTLFASDRDMFVFLADEKNRIEIKNRRDGKSGSLARGFFVWNSEVGASTFGIALFLFDYACFNRIVWGVEDYAEIRIRHTVSAPIHLREKVIPALDTYARSSTAGVQQAIEAAQQAKVDNLDKFLSARFSRPETVAIKAAFDQDEHRPIETLWDVTTAVTAYARSIPYQDERVEMERKGGAVLELVSNGNMPHLRQHAIDGDFEVIS